MIALLIGYESLTRLFEPVPISFAEAIPLAAIGLGVNLASGWMLRDDHDHQHAPNQPHRHDQRIITSTSTRSTIIPTIICAPPMSM